LNLNAVVKEV